MSKLHPNQALALFLNATSPRSPEGPDGAQATSLSPAPGRWSVQRIDTSPRIGTSAWRLHLGEGLRQVRYGLAGANGSTWVQHTEKVQGQALLSLERFEVNTAGLFEELKAVGAEAANAAALLMPLGDVCAARYRLAFLGEGEPSVTHGILPGSARDAAYWREDALQTSESADGEAGETRILASRVWTREGAVVDQPLPRRGSAGGLRLDIGVNGKRLALREHQGPAWALHVHVE